MKEVFLYAVDDYEGLDTHKEHLPVWIATQKIKLEVEEIVQFIEHPELVLERFPVIIELLREQTLENIGELVAIKSNN